MQPDQWDKVIVGNLNSVFNYCQVCTPIMMRQRGGSIINMSSVVGVHGNAGQSNYAASKAGIIGLTQSMAKELGTRGIRVNAIAPGFILTDMTEALSAEVKEKWINEIPLHRAGNPEDIARVALFLASDLAAYMTGQVLQVDGGKCV
jgi:3-oxoacyl-[acyl-carrier protein] reductase